MRTWRASKGSGTARRAATFVAALAAAVAVLAIVPLAYAPPLPTGAPFGNVLKLDGIGDYASAPDSTSLDLGDTDGEDFTLEAFVYVPDLLGEGLQTIFYKQGSYGLFVNFHAAQQDALGLRLWYGPVSDQWISVGALTDLTVGWHHVAAVYDNEWSADSDRIAFYLDGTELGASTAYEFSPGIHNSSNDLTVGAGNGLNFWHGFIDEARVSDSVRYSGDYTVPDMPYVSDGSTRALWHFDDSAGSTSFADSTGNGNTLTGQDDAKTSLPPATCGYDAGTHAATVNVPAGGSAWISRQAAPGEAITLDGHTCGAATVSNTDTVVVNGSIGTEESVSIDLSNGSFEPGFTAEGSGVSEIEFDVGLGGGGDQLYLGDGPGNDELHAGSLGVNLNGDDDFDVSLGGVSLLAVFGGPGDDTISLGGGFATGSGTLGYAAGAYGDDGNDTLTGSSGADDFYGNAGDDTISGGPGGDSFQGDAGNDTLYGGGGDDTFHEGDAPNGADVFNGGAGTDKVDYGSRTGPVTVTVADGIANDGESGESDLVRGDVENLVGGSGDDVLTGSSAANILEGRVGSDTLYGGAGSDTLSGDDGDDVLYGGPGDDWFPEGTSANGADSFSGGGGTDSIGYDGRSNSVAVTVADGIANDGESGEGDLVRSDVENVTGGSGNDTLVGSTGINGLFGGPGDDTVYAGDGNDRIEGNAGNDTLYGGPGSDEFDEDFAANGADIFNGGAGSDVVWYGWRSGAVTVTLADGLANDGESGEGDLVRSDVENVTGGAGNDTLTGSSSANQLDGGAGNDTVFAGLGNDTLTGGAGTDALYGSDGDDVFHALDGVADTLNGGNGTDTGDYDAGIDTLVAMEVP